MYIEQGIKPENKFWKYLIGSFIIIVAATIGQMPLMIAGVVKSLSDGKGIPTNQDDFMKILDSNLTLFLMLLSFAFGIAGIYFVAKYIHKQTFLSLTTSRKSVDWSRVLFSFSIWSVFTIVTTYASYYFSPQDFVWNFKPVPFLILAVVAILFIPIQTSCEEYIFRGYLMQGFGNLSKNKWFPLVMTSFIFGGMHFFNPEVEKMGYIIMVYYIGTGFLLGILTLMDEGMELSLGFHAANNLIGALLVTSDWTVFQTNSVLKDISEPTAGFDVLMPVIVVYPILLFIFSKKYGWTNWKDKLTGKIHETPTLTAIDTIGNHD
jgi:uncharacterized protein